MSNDDERAPRMTLKMGRDTVQDPPRKEIGPRGTQVLQPPPDSAPRRAGSEADVVVLGVAKKPMPSAQAKVDVSKVDPRRAPTQLGRTRRVARPMKPSTADADRRTWIITVVVLVVLVLIAAALAWVVYKQRTGGF